MPSDPAPSLKVPESAGVSKPRARVRRRDRPQLQRQRLEGREAATVRPTVPIFPQLLAGSVSHDYLNRARQFQTAATSLVGYVNGQINWPSYALLFHACELTLKAYCLQYARGIHLPKHSLMRLYEIAEQHGLAVPANIAPALEVLEDMHAL
jgi:hypothetical protein